MTIKTSAFVLQRRTIRDADIMATIFSKDLGKISVIASKAKKDQSTAAHLEMFNLCSFILSGNKDPLQVRSVEAIKIFRKIRENFNKLETGATMSQTIQRITAQGQANPELFSLLARWLNRLDRAVSLRGFIPAFYRAVLRTEGLIAPGDKKSGKEYQEMLLAYANQN